MIKKPFPRANDIDKATAAKYKVEQKQREEAKVRKDENSLFANKVRYIKYSGKWNDQFFCLILVFQKCGRSMDLPESVVPQIIFGTGKQLVP